MRVVLHILSLISLVGLVYSGDAPDGWAGESCPSHKKTDSSVHSIWRESEDNSLLMDLRSNAPHYWRFAHEYGDKWFNHDLLTEGIVTGDPHNTNIANVWISNRFHFTVVDIDDGGTAPFILDISRNISIANAALDDDVAEDLFRAYIKGLKGVKAHAPDILRETRETDQEEYEKEKEDYISDLTNKKGEFQEGVKGLRPISSAPRGIKNEYNKAYEIFKKELKGYDILDVAYRIKETGGSQGMPRFWFSLEDSDGDAEVVEFKRLTTPATQEWQAQKPHGERLKDMLTTYWPLLNKKSLFRHVAVADKSYWMRPRGPSYIEIEEEPESDEDWADYLEYSLFVANRIGYAQGQQKSGVKFASYVLGHAEETLAQVKCFTKTYLAEVKKIRR